MHLWKQKKPTYRWKQLRSLFNQIFKEWWILKQLLTLLTLLYWFILCWYNWIIGIKHTHTVLLNSCVQVHDKHKDISSPSLVAPHVWEYKHLPVCSVKWWTNRFIWIFWIHTTTNDIYTYRVYIYILYEQPNSNWLRIVKHILGESLQLIEECIMH